MTSWLTRKLQNLTTGSGEPSSGYSEVINDLQREFNVSSEKLREIADGLKCEMRKGLEQTGQTVAMVPSYVTGRPDGKEQGRYLALDLGGTNLRVCEVHLSGDGKVSMKQQKYTISQELQTGPVRDLFDYMATCIDKYVTEHSSMETRELPATKLGFTFSFPVLQTALDRGTLIHWTKGFNCSGVEGKDIVELLRDALSRKNVPVEVLALVNDTVGTLISQGYKDPNTLLGVILGTGTNGAYFEKISNIKKLTNTSLNPDDTMVINMEWGAFDNERRVLPVTMFDNKLDRKSVNPRKQTFEKLVSGMYLGEISRNVILHLIDRNILFDGYSSADLNKMWSFETGYMSIIENDKSADLTETQHILENTLSLPKTSLEERRIVKKIVELVGTRAARLAAAAFVGVTEHCNSVEKGCSIGIDGSLYHHYPGFRERVRAAMRELLGEKAENIKLTEASDGSGIGAAIIACLANKA
ncbi:uncharacterized protein VTP21DRAFT_6471 [Calcarisporiella thermophila]|uniref:uncharacterized protein n=1 Tax=Calcarisporiella thermophila TaxID=911321 RepID=UPI0037437138